MYLKIIVCLFEIFQPANVQLCTDL